MHDAKRYGNIITKIYFNMIELDDVVRWGLCDMKMIHFYNVVTGQINAAGPAGPKHLC